MAPLQRLSRGFGYYVERDADRLTEFLPGMLERTLLWNQI